MAGIYQKPSFYFVKGYKEFLDWAAPTRHLNKTCFSYFNRYPLQTNFIKNMMMSSKDGALKILNIGVSQGQEPLTHINSAFYLSKTSNRPISDFIDLKTVDILREPPALCAEATDLDSKVVGFLRNVYDSRSGKSMWGMPVEQVIEQMLKKGDKQDVILFNNVLQHMAYQDLDVLFGKIDGLVKLVKDKGIFCFSVSGHTLDTRETVLVERMKNLLKQNNFEEVVAQSGIYRRVS